MTDLLLDYILSVWIMQAKIRKIILFVYDYYNEKSMERPAGENRRAFFRFWEGEISLP